MRIQPPDSTKNFRQDSRPRAYVKTPLGKGKIVEVKEEEVRRDPAVIIDLSDEAKALIS